MGTLPSDTFKKLKLNVNSTTPVLFSLLILPIRRPQCLNQNPQCDQTPITMYPKKPYEPHGHDTITEVKKDEEPKDTPQKGLKGPTIINELESNRIKEEKEFGWLDIEDPLDLVNTCEESVYESLIKEIPRKHEWITFMEGCREVTFKTPFKDPERRKLTSDGHDLASPRIILSKEVDKLGPEYRTRPEESNSGSKVNKGEVT
ncbi:hypothetical protein Tco_0898574 [Tanacetum coccineum]